MYKTLLLRTKSKLLLKNIFDVIIEEYTIVVQQFYTVATLGDSFIHSSHCWKSFIHSPNRSDSFIHSQNKGDSFIHSPHQDDSFIHSPHKGDHTVAKLPEFFKTGVTVVRWSANSYEGPFRPEKGHNGGGCERQRHNYPNYWQPNARFFRGMWRVVMPRMGEMDRPACDAWTSPGDEDFPQLTESVIICVMVSIKKPGWHRYAFICCSWTDVFIVLLTFSLLFLLHGLACTSYWCQIVLQYQFIDRSRIDWNLWVGAWWVHGVESFDVDMGYVVITVS